jgi:carotenoid cleavage dioxygenase-like enzyme
MNITVVRRYPSKLPQPDLHPYRTGAWTPNTVEVDATDLDVIEGEIPRDLSGTYLRNTENPLLEAISGRYHPFDGDGMVHAIHFADGRADYRNRFVRTSGLLAELEADAPLWAGILESPAASLREGCGARTRMKDASSTDIIVHRGEALTTFYQCGAVHRLDPRTLETLGVASAFPSFVSAHPKVDEATGELLFFEYSKVEPFMHVGAIGSDGQLLRYLPVSLPGPRLPHDMAFTARFAIVNDLPLFWDPGKLAQNDHRPRFFPELGSRFGLVPRDGVGAIRWFTAEPTYVLHFTNAWEDGDEVVLEGFHQSTPMPRGDTPTATFMKTLDMNELGTRLHRWRFNLVTGMTREEQLDDEIAEFPSIDARFAGRRHERVIAMTGAPGMFLFDGMVRYDLEKNTKQRYRFPDGVYASESPIAGEYVVTFTTDVRNDRSECQIFREREIERGPIARVRLPHRISSGTHATWMP